MALELRQQLKLTQQLVMTPQLQMAIKLLQLSRLELVETIQQELEENPILEEAVDNEPEQVEKDTEKGEEKDPKEIEFDDTFPDDADWRNYIEEYNTPGKTSYEIERKEHTEFDRFLVKKQSLQDHLLWQLMMSGLNEMEKQVGSLIVGNLNTDGYLDVSVEDITAESGASPQTVEEVLSLMQTFDPLGICARNLRESLLIQIKHLGLEDSLVERVISDHLTHLENRKITTICQALSVDRQKIIEAVEIIQGLEPKPGRSFSDEPPRHITPDVYVYKYDDEFVILLNDNGLPRLRINALYRSCLLGDSQVSGKEKEYIREKLRSATWLIRSVYQRKKTIYRVMESVLRFQQAFFEKGVSQLKPMVLRDVAEDIEMHESTISRVTTNKYAHTPQGIFELKYFFNSPINRVHGDAIASASVKDKIKRIIEKEDPKKPYSDKKISVILENDNINIARRTVAKYREMLNILPSSKRKQLF